MRDIISDSIFSGVPMNEDTATQDTGSPLLTPDHDVLFVGTALLEMAVPEVGKEQHGNHIQRMLGRVLKETELRLPFSVHDLPALLRWAKENGATVEPHQVQAGDIGILQRGSSQAFWSFLIHELLDDNRIAVIQSQSAQPSAATELRLLQTSILNRRHLWRTVAFIRF